MEIKKLAVVLSVGHDPVRKLSGHSVYEQVDRGKLVRDTISHGRFTIIVDRGLIAFIKQDNGTLYKLYPLLAVQYKIQWLSYTFGSVLLGKYLKKSLKIRELGLDIIGRELDNYEKFRNAICSKMHCEINVGLLVILHLGTHILQKE